MSAATGLLLEVLREPERARTLDAHAWDLVLRQALAANLLAALAWWLEPLGAEALPPASRKSVPAAAAAKERRDLCMGLVSFLTVGIVLNGATPFACIANQKKPAFATRVKRFLFTGKDLAVG